MTTLLLTGIGGDVAQGVATVLRETFPDWKLLGSDASSFHGGSLYVNEVLESPGADDPAYEQWLADIIERYRVDFCLPLSERELDFMLNHRMDTLEGARIITAGFKALEVGGDKLATARFLERIGLPAPWTIPSEEVLSDDLLPCIYKPRSGSGSKGIFVCRTSDEAAFYSRHYPHSVFQELLYPDDREVTCAVFRARNGDIAVLQLLRVLAGGMTKWARVIDDDAVAYQCRRVAEALEVVGSINIQLRITANGPRIFEINPRFSSTSLLRYRMGFQDVVWTLQDCKSEAVEFYLPPVGTTAVRILEAKALVPVA